MIGGAYIKLRDIIRRRIPVQICMHQFHENKDLNSISGLSAAARPVVREGSMKLGEILPGAKEMKAEALGLAKE
jgi:hypothetical protein